ncbi:phosphoenolpyruvate carboxykinase, partial [Campylobacter concisus]
SGQPSLNALRGAGLINVGVLIVRYFGGIKLGTGGLVRAYSGAVNEAINEAIKDGGVMKFEIKNEIKFFTPFSLMSRFEHCFATKNLSEFERDFNDLGAIWSVNLNEAEFAELFKFCKEFEASEFKFLALPLGSKALFIY